MNMSAAKQARATLSLTPGQIDQETSAWCPIVKRTASRVTLSDGSTLATFSRRKSGRWVQVGYPDAFDSPRIVQTKGSVTIGQEWSHD